MPRTPPSLRLALAACALFALVSLEALQPRARAAATFVVTNTNDSGGGSLRQAVLDANANPGADTITFQIGTGPQTIKLAQRLPSLTEAVVIDGATQPGYAGAPIIELDGSSAPDGSGLVLAGGDSTVRGLVIHSFSGTGIFTGTKGGNRIEGCYIGTDMTGTLDRGNGNDGIYLPTSNNVVGGTSPAQRNVISGNGGYGINVSRFCCTGDESPITNNVIQGNYIGTSAAGDAAIPNVFGGVRISSVNSGVPVTNNAVGGTAAGAGNLISGNGQSGVFLDGSGVANNTVQGNFVGTDATGSFSVPNAGAGVAVTGQNNLIGGSAAGARNVISGNGPAAGLGIGVMLGSLPGNVLRGNLIGVNALQTAPLPNGNAGVVLGGTNTVIGGTGPGEANVIAFNGMSGVSVSGGFNSPATNNPVRGNSIFSNGAFNSPQASTIGIDLVPDFGVTPNDSGDGDAGGNKLQNFPVITSVTPGASSFNVKGTLGSAASTAYDLDFYAGGACDPTGYGEGARHVGSAQVTTDSGGLASFDLTFNVALASQQVLSATATDPAGNTSEFSQCVPAGPASVGSVGFDPATVSVLERDGVATFVVTRTGGAAGSVTVNYLVRGQTAQAGSDFTQVSGVLTFGDGETSKTFTIPVLDDALDEFDERAVVTLRVGGGDLDVIGARGTATLVITDDDPTPAVSVGDVSAAEGNAGTTGFEFPVTLSAVSGRDVTVNFNTESGTATGGGNDFNTIASSQLVIPAGQAGGKITVLVRGDADSEPDETFFVNLTSATSAFVGDGRAQGTIVNDDAAPAGSLSVNDASVTEGDAGQVNAAFTVSLSAASAATVKVDVSTANDTAADFFPADYQAVNATLTFAPGETTKTVNVAVNGDLLNEADETFRLELRNPVGASITDGTGVGTILNDDPLPTISVKDVSFFEGHSGVNFINIDVSISAPSGRPVQFRVRTVGNTATADEDFVPADYVAGITPGATTAFVLIPVHGDTITEPDETFFVDISEVVNATIADARGVALIRNDDTPSRPTTLQFDRRARTVSESANSVTVTVTRSGNASQAVTVDYATQLPQEPTAASVRSDYTFAAGTLRFAAGETTKSFDVLLTDDGRAEPQEFVIVELGNATGGANLGDPARTRINIDDNDSPPPSVNPIDTTAFFVRQHYHDFLNREPDAAGLNFWTQEIEQCGADAGCREAKRVSVSQAFFLSIEFQRTGYRVFRLYRATFPDSVLYPRGMPRMGEFLRDTQEIGRGVIVGAPGWEEQLTQNVTDFARRWVARAEVLAQLPETLTAAQFVDKLFANSGVTPTAQERDEALAAYGAGGVEGRAAALLSVTGSASVFNRQYNPAFVYMQYAGYLRRHPTETPDTNFTGFDFWLSKLDSFTLPGEDARDETIAVRRVQRAEMVKAFLSSIEYRQRFGTP